MIDPYRAAESAKRIVGKLNAAIPEQAVVLSVLGQMDSVPFNLDDDGTGVLIIARGNAAKFLMEAIHKGSTRTEVEKVRLKPKPEEPNQN